MTSVQIYYDEIVADAMKDIGQQTLRKDGLSSLERRGMDFKKILIDSFGEPCDSDLYFMRCHLLDLMLEGIRRVWKLFVLDRSPYELPNMHFRQLKKVRCKEDK